MKELAMVFRGLGAAVVLCWATATAGAQPAMNTLTDAQKSEGWTLLFDGATLDGWTTSGDISAWGVEKGEVVVTKPGKGWWLRTAKMYRDFELFIDFVVPKGGNSGVGLRGSSVGDPAFTGFEIQILDTLGLDPKLTNCGAVYDAIAPVDMAVNKAGDWNTYQIRLVGDTLDVWLNGRKIHDSVVLDDRGYIGEPSRKSPLRDRLTTGYISLQDHGDAVRFRNIRIKDLSRDPDPGSFQPIFNGKDLTGWKQRGGGSWKVEEGTLVGRDGPGHLFSDGTYTDFEARAFVRVNTKGNSGFYFRTHPRKDDPETWPDGYEAQVDNHDPKNFTGCIYDRAWGTKPITRDNAWFDYCIRAEGNRIRTWINGVPMVDTTLDNFAAGHFAFQTHHQGNEIRFRDVQVRELPKRQSGAPALSEPVRLVYCTHSAGFRHGVLPESAEVMKLMGQRLEWLEVETTDIAAVLTPERLAETDAVMLYTTGRLPIDPAVLLKWVEGGGALVGVHSATDTFADSAEYVGLIGGSFDGHPWNEQVQIVVDSPRHPAMAPFLTDATRDQPAPRFTIADEIYQFVRLNPKNNVIMSLAPDTPKVEKGRAYPLAWWREIGRGRVFYTALGHRPEVWRDARFVEHVAAGIRWAARRCPQCSQSLEMVPIAYGLPTTEMQRRAEKGEIVLGARIVYEGAPQFCGRCAKCGYLESAGM